MKHEIDRGMIAACLAIAALFWLFFHAMPVKADYVYLGGWTKHFDGVPATNESHNMAIYERGRWIGGYYRNSYGDDTGIIGYKFHREIGENWEASIAVGASYGYRACMERESSKAPKRLCPAFMPEIVYTRYRIQPSFVFLGDGVGVAIRIKL